MRDTLIHKIKLMSGIANNQGVLKQMLKRVNYKINKEKLWFSHLKHCAILGGPSWKKKKKLFARDIRFFRYCKLKGSPVVGTIYSHAFGYCSNLSNYN